MFLGNSDRFYLSTKDSKFLTILSLQVSICKSHSNNNWKETAKDIRLGERKKCGERKEGGRGGRREGRKEGRKETTFFLHCSQGFYEQYSLTTWPFLFQTRTPQFSPCPFLPFIYTYFLQEVLHILTLYKLGIPES